MLRDPEVLTYLKPEEIEEACNLDHHLRHVDFIFRRVFGT
jgi:adenylosuccinate lyase